MESPTNTRTSRTMSALAGVSAAVLSLGMAEFISTANDRLQSPVISVGDRVVDLVPAWVKDIAIEVFGTGDKIALLVGIGTILTLYAATLGVVALRHSLRNALLGLALFALIGSAAATFTRTGSNPLGWIPTVGGSLFFALALIMYRSLFARWSIQSTAGDAHPSERRRVVATMATVGLAGAAGFTLGRSDDRAVAGDISRRAAELPPVAKPLPPISPSVQAGPADSFITKNADFYRIDTALVVPQVPVDDWTLRIHGLVDDEVTLSFDDLIDREIVESDITLTCVSNTIGGRLVGNARWTGIRLDDLLDDIGVDASADQIVGRSVDGYTCGFPVSALDGRDALIAIGMNGELLPVEHGFPARLIVPGLYGYVSATKWLSEIKLTTFDAFDHYWVPRGYSAEAPIKMQSRIDAPRGLDRIDEGPFVIGGVAWAQPTGISEVEISIDDGEWQQTTLAEELSGSTWRQWSYEWIATPGSHSITVRAKDQEGAIQTPERSEPLPDGAAGHHTVVVLVGGS